MSNSFSNLRFRIIVNDNDFPANRYGVVRHFDRFEGDPFKVTRHRFVYGFNVRPDLDVDPFVYDAYEQRWYTCDPVNVIRAIARNGMVEGELTPVDDTDLRERLVRHGIKLYRITAPYWMTAQTLGIVADYTATPLEVEHWYVDVMLFVSHRVVFRSKDESSWFDMSTDGFYAQAPYFDLLRPDMTGSYRTIVYSPVMRPRLTIGDIIERGYVCDLLPERRRSLLGREPDGVETFHLPHAKVVFDGETVAVFEREHVWLAAGRTLDEALDALNLRTNWPPAITYEWLETVPRPEDKYNVVRRRMIVHDYLPTPLFEEAMRWAPIHPTVFASDKTHPLLYCDDENSEFGIKTKL